MIKVIIKSIAFGKQTTVIAGEGASTTATEYCASNQDGLYKISGPVSVNEADILKIHREASTDDLGMCGMTMVQIRHFDNLKSRRT